MKKEIIIIHQFYTPSHYFALYNSEKYNVSDYYILSKKEIVKKFLKSKLNFLDSFKELIKDLWKLKNLKKLKDKILIVGLAPYDKLLMENRVLFQNNYSIYHTSWDNWSGEDFVKGKKLFKSKFEKILVEDFKGIAVVTEKVMKNMKKEGIFNKYSVINHALNIREYSIKIDYTQKRKILYLGRLVKVKNLDLIFKFLENNKSLDIQFYFGGSGKEEKKIKEISFKDNRVKFLGRLSTETIKKEIKHYDYLILPSKFEPFGIVVIEALASGVPCIVSDVIGHGEIITDSKDGFVFKNNDYDDFERVLFRSIEIDEETYEVLSKNSLLKAKRYDVKEIIKKWEELFKTYVV